MSDLISRQAAISAICNACGKIDCDKMDKCEKLQLPPANCSEFPNNSDTISRQAAIDAMAELQGSTSSKGVLKGISKAWKRIEQLPPIQPEPHEIGYDDCSNALLKMWMDNVLTDGDYYRIADKLNKKWGKTELPEPYKGVNT